MKFQMNDGGREISGFSTAKPVGDCVTRSIAILTGLPYKKVYRDLLNLAKMENGKYSAMLSRSHPKKGIYDETLNKYLIQLGFKKITLNCGITSPELPQDKKILVVLVRHVPAMIDGTEHSTFSVAADYNKRVYGYWIKD
jgi:hypothetical protein